MCLVFMHGTVAMGKSNDFPVDAYIAYYNAKLSCKYVNKFNHEIIHVLLALRE